MLIPHLIYFRVPWAYALFSAKLQQSDFGKHRQGWIPSANVSSTVLIESQDEISLLGLGVSFLKLKSNSFFGHGMDAWDILLITLGIRDKLDLASEMEVGNSDWRWHLAICHTWHRCKSKST